MKDFQRLNPAPHKSTVLTEWMSDAYYDLFDGGRGYNINDTRPHFVYWGRDGDNRRSYLFDPRDVAIGVIDG